MTTFALLAFAWLLFVLFGWALLFGGTRRPDPKPEPMSDRTAAALADFILLDADLRGYDVPKDRPSMAPVGETTSPERPPLGEVNNP